MRELAEDHAELGQEHIAKLLNTTQNLWIGVEFVRHLTAVFKKLPLPVLRQLAEEIEPAFLAPDPLFGRVMQFDRFLDFEDIVVYLSPELLSRPPGEIEAVIAHEMAHVILGHKEIPSRTARANGERDERAADEHLKS